MQITITNTRIIDFFNKSEMDVEIFILKNIDFFEYVSSSIKDNNTTQILPYILSQSNLINNLIEKQTIMEKNIEIVKDGRLDLLCKVDKLSSDNLGNMKDIQNIILQNNVDYMNKTREIIVDLEKTVNSNSSNSIHDIIHSFDKKLSDNNNSLLATTKEIINSITNNTTRDIISLSKDIESSSKNLEIINSNSLKDIKDYIKDNNQLSFISNELNNNIHNQLSSSVNIIKTSIDDSINTIKPAIDNISNIFLHKNSSVKGKVSENILEVLLSKTFPSYIIQRTSSEARSGDFILRNETSNISRPAILLENKDYDKNVNTDEINKFIRDVKEHSICGILVSQNSGISTKNNFDIEIKDNNILIYIHNCNYDMDKIQLAVDIIYSMNDIIIKNNNTENFIDELSFKNIQEDYLAFIRNRNETISLLNMSIKNIKKLDVISIKNIIEKNTCVNNTSAIICNELLLDGRQCEKLFTSNASLAAHKKKHFNERKKTDKPEN